MNCRGLVVLQDTPTHKSTPIPFGSPGFQGVLLKKGVSLGHQDQDFSAPTPSLVPEVQIIAASALNSKLNEKGMLNVK